MNRLTLAVLFASTPFVFGEEPKLSKDEQEVIDLTNAERKAANLPPLKVNASLLEAARSHAANMAKQDKLEHVLDGKTHTDRTKAAGYASGFVGENISWNSKDPKETVAGWMNSQGHKDNILNKDCRHRRRRRQEREGRAVLGAGVR